MSIQEKIQEILKEAKDFKIDIASDFEKYRLKFLVKKSEFNELFEQLKSAGAEEKKTLGKLLNEARKEIEERYRSATSSAQGENQKKQSNDLSLPVFNNKNGGRHPLSLVAEKINGIFSRIGFIPSEGPEIEDDWHNFSALNFAENHPARDMQDTFFINEEKQVSLRTHTSSVQVRVMENSKPPIRTISLGRVYRNEAVSARANCFFHQVEGLYINTDVSFADLKQTLYYFVKEMFGEGIDIRFRPSYFPFTEPSAEMDITCLLCRGKGCNVCKHTGWVEILGCGMVHPNVLKNCSIDPEKYSGFAFGMGVERITMLKYDIKDLRIFFENDVRFLNQFR